MLRALRWVPDHVEGNAAESRFAVHRRIDELVGHVGHLETSAVTIVADVAEMKPVTDDVKRWKLMGIGALVVTGIVAMASASASPRRYAELCLP